METQHILVADDDREILKLISESLEDEGFYVHTASNGREVLERVSSDQVSLFILDIMMPGMDGLEVCRSIRHQTAAPIIFLSAKSRELDKVVGLEVGADDYVTKPFSVNELVARVKAHLRRERRKRFENETAPAGNAICFGNVSINKETYELFVDSEKVNLSTKEFQILVYLVENKNLVLSREQIYDAIWGQSEFGDLNTVTVHIKNLRDKMDKENQYIKTVWGVGYKFVGGSR